MTSNYIGVKAIQAWPQDRDGQPGYAVKYSDGYTSWCPTEVFEAAYLDVGEDPSKIAGDVVDRFIVSIERGERMGNHGVFLVTLANGFTLVEESACVSPENFDWAKAEEIVREKVRRQVWHLLGFTLAWANKGLKSPTEE